MVKFCFKKHQFTLKLTYSPKQNWAMTLSSTILLFCEVLGAGTFFWLAHIVMAQSLLQQLWVQPISHLSCKAYVPPGPYSFFLMLAPRRGAFLSYSAIFSISNINTIID